LKFRFGSPNKKGRSGQVLFPPQQKVKLAKKRKKPAQRVQQEKVKTTFSDKFLKLALRLMGRPAKKIISYMPNLRDDILKSNLNISPQGIVAISLFATVMCVPVIAFGMVILIGLGMGLFSVFLPFILPFPFVIGISLPKISASSRAQALENELPYLVGYITVLAGGGISPMTTMKRISKAGSIFPAAAKEASRILLDVEIFGMDAISALEKAARNAPNRMFSDFIGGYVAVLNTGGNVVSYLENKVREIFAYRESKVKSSSEFIGTLAEAYIIATAVMGVSFTVLFATQNLMSTSTSGVDPSMIILFSGIFIPVISLVFIVVLNSVQVREPFNYELPYWIFFACCPIAAIMFFLPVAGLPQYLKLGIGLALVSTPSMILNIIYTKRKKAVEGKLANFLRDISEVRKTGLAPEKTIEQLSGRNYGGLSEHVKAIATQLSWGTPIRIVLVNFSKKVKSWITRAMAFLLLEVVDVGGGSAGMFISLADFTEKNDQLEKARRSEIRPYVIIPYIGAILVVVTTAMISFFIAVPGLSPSTIGVAPGATLGAGAALPSQQVAAQLTGILLTGSIFQSWFMGMVAGKMGEGSVADGFKHATMLVIISLVTVLVAGTFIGALG
jgi:flagellar protein FlaJ